MTAEGLYLQTLSSLLDREATCWKMTKVFLDNKDAHGVMDMGAELQALQRAIAEVQKVRYVERTDQGQWS